jgi:hypothetical protein
MKSLLVVTVLLLVACTAPTGIETSTKQRIELTSKAWGKTVTDIFWKWRDENKLGTVSEPAYYDEHQVLVDFANNDELTVGSYYHNLQIRLDALKDSTGRRFWLGTSGITNKRIVAIYEKWCN